MQILKIILGKNYWCVESPGLQVCMQSPSLQSASLQFASVAYRLGSEINWHTVFKVISIPQLVHSMRSAFSVAFIKNCVVILAWYLFLVSVTETAVYNQNEVRV